MVTFVVVLNSFTTGRRAYFAGDRYVDRKAQARTFTESDALLVAQHEQARIGRSVVMDIAGLDNSAGIR